jgi:adenylosuccinate lyase
MVLRLDRVLDGLRVYPDAMLANLNRTQGLVFSQSVLGALLRKGMERQEAYATVQRAAMDVWEKRADGFKAALLADPSVCRTLTETELEQAFGLDRYTQHVSTLLTRAGIEEA